VNILDENIPEHQRQKLKDWRIRDDDFYQRQLCHARPNFMNGY
jgi:hypothetical protein